MNRFLPTHRPALGADELSAVAVVFESGWLGPGTSTTAFEQELQKSLDVPHVVAVSSGTAALHLALDALDLPAASGVLVPSLTFVATVQAILAAGLRPIFCEVDPHTMQLDLDDALHRLSAARRLGHRVSAVMPVHFGGTAGNLEELVALAAQHGLSVVEDAAHAFGSSRNGRALGTFGVAGCFSFDPIKNITCGEGGAIATRQDELAARVRRSRALGISSDGWSRHTGATSWMYSVDGRGWRAHLPNMNAAIGLAQLARLPEFRARRQSIVAHYDAALAGLDTITRVTRPQADVCPFTYTIRVHDGRRDQLVAHLRAEGIGTSVEYIPNHLQPAFQAFHTSLPVTERLFGEILSLPLYPGLTDGDVTRVVETAMAHLTAQPAS